MELQSACRAFTLVELMAAIVIIGILSALLLPALSKSKIQAQGVQCVSNLRQLGLGWQLYADDNGGHYPVNGSTVANEKAVVGESLGNPSWVAGVLQPTSRPDNTNASLLVGQAYAPFASIGPYVKNSAVYHCPADMSQDPGNHLMRVRSVSLNGWMNPGRTNTAATYWTMKFQTFCQSADFRKIGPSSVFAFLDESAASINDGWLYLCMNGYNGVNSIDVAELNLYDVPAAYHNLCGSFSYADGHAEPHRWQGGLTMNNNDIIWLLTHATIPQSN